MADWLDKYADASLADNANPVGDGAAPETAWNIRTALLSAPVNSYVWVKRHSAAFTLTQGTLVVGNTGVIATNNRIAFHGYHTVEGDASAGDFTSDMDIGGNYYQSPTEALIAGTIDTTKCIDIDGDDIAGDLISITDKQCIEFHHFYFHNTNRVDGSNLIECITLPEACLFKNCRFGDTWQAITGTSYDFQYVDCLFEDYQTGYVVTDIRSSHFVGCIFNNPAARYGVFLHADGFFGNCLFIGGYQGMNAYSGTIAVNNCTFYNQTVRGILVHHASCVLAEYNNIFAPAAQADYAVLQDAGCILYSDYSCAYCIGSGALTNAWYDSDNARNFKGKYSIEEDPQFVDAPNNDFRLKPTSPCLNTGKPTLHSGCSSMGAWQRKQYPIGVRLDGLR